jgi:hypothetical protein
MDISSRSPQPAGNPISNPSPVGDRPSKPKASKVKKYAWYRVGVTVAVAAVVVLLVGITLLIYANNHDTKDTESSYIKNSKLQAVFLETGQVYFGNIKTLNNNFMVLDNIFYLQTSGSGSSTTSTTGSTSGSNVSLVKLGCELHMPYDQMVINRSQVTFWENLQSNGQVAKAVATYDQAHPNGTTCTDQSSSSTSTTNAAQSANTGSTTTPATTPTTK